MDIYMIWAQDAGYKWLVEAWDNDSVQDNFKGYEEAIAKARADHGVDNVRIVKACVDFDKVVAAFEVPDVGALT